MTHNQRLIITKVVLENFKSYAGIRTIGPFHISFSAVVGPNGSGKSNLLECLLFAFGKRAKKMRLNKISELIHKSNTFPSLTFAKVEIFFQSLQIGSNQPIHNSEFSISRTVFKNNSSAYKINNRDSGYEEVVNLLKARCIDLEHNRFLILQGEVEQIAMMRPKGIDENKSGLLEYLEEIIGTDRYIEEIERIEKELEESAEQITVRKVQAEQAAKVITDLIEPLGKVRGYLELNRQLYQFINLRTQILREQVKRERGKVEEGRERLRSEIVVLEEEFNKKKLMHSEVLNGFESKMAELKQLERQEAVVKAQINDLIKADQELNEELEILKNKIKALDDEITSEIQRITYIDKSVCDTEFSLPGIIDHFEKIKAERIRVENEFNELNSTIVKQTEGAQLKKDQIIKELAPLKQQYNKLKIEIEANKKHLDEVLKEKESNSTEKSELTAELQICQDYLSTKLKERENVQNNISDTEKLTAKYNTGLKEVRAKADEIERSISEFKRLLSDIEKDEKSFEGLSRQYREIMSAKREGLLKGVIGRLGDLGSIDNKYDIAVSSSSHMFDYILVDSVSSGESLIKFTRDKSLGKINIIVLEKVNLPYSSSFTSPDNKAQRIFDLITFKDQSVAKAFYLALRDTLIADSLEECRRIAFCLKQRWRVVCLSGEVFNPAGEMLGFSRPVCGKLRLNSSDNVSDYTNRADLLRCVKEHSETYEQLYNEIRNIEGNIALKNHLTVNLLKELKIVNHEAEGKKEKIQSLEFRLDTLERRLSEFNEARTEQAEEFIGKNIKALEKLEKVVFIKEQEIERIDLAIEGQAGEEFRDMKAKRSYLVQTEEKLEQDLMKHNKKLQQFQKDKEKYTNAKNKSESERKAIALKIDEIRAHRKKIEHTAIEKTTGVAEIFEKSAACKEALKQLESSKEEIRTKFSGLSAKRELLSESFKSLTDHQSLLEISCDKLTEKIQLNRESFAKQNLNCLEEIQEIAIEHANKRPKSCEDLLFEVTKDFDPAELEQHESRLKIIQDSENEISRSLSESQVDLSILDFYQQKKTEKAEKDAQLLHSLQLDSTKRSYYLELKSKRLAEFNTGFFEISNQLRDIYRLITKGGDAELEFADSTDPFSEGVVFTVRPANKSWKKMTNLSGGEKTLSSLALVFALHAYKPNCLYVMDEVDAALDFQNVAIVASFIKARTKNAQFIVVSLRYQMFELADQLVGVYKTQDVSDTITISPYVFIGKENRNEIIVQTVQNITVK